MAVLCRKLSRVAANSKNVAVTTLKTAERVSEILAAHGIDCAVIGGVALSFHKYVRGTVDIDLATSVNPFTDLREAQKALEADGFQVEFRMPDAEDSLGGVLDVRRGDTELVQIVNYENPFGGGNAALGREAVATAELFVGTSLKVANLPHLIALKLYAGGSQDDVFQLLQRRPELDLSEVDTVCSRFQLSAEWAQVKTSLKASGYVLQPKAKP